MSCPATVRPPTACIKVQSRCSEIEQPTRARQKNRIINIHPALLPSFPGLDAQRQAVEYGAKYSGCTVHLVDTGVDSGPIILQRVVKVLDSDTETTLAKRILQKEHQAYTEAVRLFAENKIKISGRKIKII